MAVLTTTFELAADDPRAAEAELLAAIEAFGRDRFTPRGVYFEIALLDPDLPFIEMGPPPRPYWFIRGPGFFDERISDDDVVSVVEDLVPTHDIVTAIIEEALAQPVPHGTPTLSDLRWEGVDDLERAITLRGTNRFHTATLELGVDRQLIHPDVAKRFDAGLIAVGTRIGWRRLSR